MRGPDGPSPLDLSKFPPERRNIFPLPHIIQLKDNTPPNRLEEFA